MATLIPSLTYPPPLACPLQTKIDWEADKAAVGDEHELAINRKNGQLEKNNFLSRVDQNLFERERDERLRSSAARSGSNH